MISYDWVDLQTPQGYDRLVEVLDPEFDPKGIAQRLKTQLTHAAKGVLVEHGYVDKDYRSTFYNFYAKMGRPYRSDCVRLHFFDETVWYDEARIDIVCSDPRLQDHYFGYIVLRPTIVATLGRSLLSPDMRLGARGRAIQSVHYVNLLGHRLSIWGFPSMAQHRDNQSALTCAAGPFYDITAKHIPNTGNISSTTSQSLQPRSILVALSRHWASMFMRPNAYFNQRVVSHCLLEGATPLPTRRSFPSCSLISNLDFPFS